MASKAPEQRVTYPVVNIKLAATQFFEASAATVRGAADASGSAALVCASIRSRPNFRVPLQAL